MKRNVIIALMSYSGCPEDRVKSVCVAALNELVQKHGWDGAVMTISGDAMLPRARNVAVGRFLAIPDATDLIFIDDDNFTVEASGLARLVEHDVDFVGAPCRSRCEPEKWPVRWLHEDIKRSANGLIEVEGVGTGILRLSRACLEDMCNEYGDRWFEHEAVPDKRCVALFDYAIENHHWWGEDYLFCKRWRDMGGRIFVDPDIATVHVGKFEFTGSVGDWLHRMGGNWTLNSPESGKSSQVVNWLSHQFESEGTEAATADRVEGQQIHNKAPCAWCGRTYEEHETFRAPNQPVPRVPCSLLRSGYVAKPEPAQEAAE